jgi:hypothetical protein
MPRWVRERRRWEQERQRSQIVNRMRLISFAKDRVDDEYNVAAGKVGEPSNGALLLRLAASAESSRS